MPCRPKPTIIILYSTTQLECCQQMLALCSLLCSMLIKEGHSRPENQRLGLRAQTNLQLLTNDNQWWSKRCPSAKMKKLHPSRADAVSKSLSRPHGRQPHQAGCDSGWILAAPIPGSIGFPALRPLFGCFSEPGAEVADPRRRLPRGARQPVRPSRKCAR